MPSESPNRHLSEQRAVDEVELDAIATRFLIQESSLLDERRYVEWLSYVEDDFLYRIPVPLVREDPRLARFDSEAVLFEATKTTLEFKLGRMDNKSAWSDRPHSFTRRSVTNITAAPVEDSEVELRSNLLVAITPAGEQPSLVTAGRIDRVRISDSGAWRFARRTVYLDVEVPTGVQLSIVF